MIETFQCILSIPSKTYKLETGTTIKCSGYVIDQLKPEIICIYFKENCLDLASRIEKTLEKYIKLHKSKCIIKKKDKILLLKDFPNNFTLEDIENEEEEEEEKEEKEKEENQEKEKEESEEEDDGITTTKSKSLAQKKKERNMKMLKTKQKNIRNSIILSCNDQILPLHIHADITPMSLAILLKKNFIKTIYKPLSHQIVTEQKIYEKYQRFILKKKDDNNQKKEKEMDEEEEVSKPVIRSICADSSAGSASTRGISRPCGAPR